ncbi:MAG TPA: hypothetical protein VGO25_08785 [Rhodanobacteraceae bacterium]|nr:hypothetical protein [Rhodanobacteraceae bacterium]
MRTFLRLLAPAAWLCGLVLVFHGFIFEAASAADAREEVFRVYQKMMDSRFAVDITTVSGSDTIRSHGDYDTVERIHFKNDKMEMIVLPEGTWMRTANEWTKPPIDMSGMVKQFIPKSVDDIRAATKSASDGGMTTWNGTSVHALTYDVDTTIMGIHVTSTNKIYINAAGQIVHADSDGEAMGRKSHTTQDIRYDESIRVVAPK